LIGFLSGCATYQPIKLDATDALRLGVEQLKTDASRHTELPRAWRSDNINLMDGLNENEIIQLVVLNNPHLTAVQTQLNEANAQLIQAGLLPDPQLNVSADFPRGNDPTLFTAYGIGLGFDLQALMMRGARQSTATRQARVTYLQVLWQEWQVIGQARMLYRRALMQQQQVKLTHSQFLQTQKNWKIEQQALQQGNATIDAEGLARTAIMDAQAAWFEAKRQQSTTLHNLKLLLELSPLARLSLSVPEDELSAMMHAPVDGTKLQDLLYNLDHKRPDLMALKAGYSAQEAMVHQQILAQFPSITIGANSLRDTGKVWTLGPFINLNLPLLNGNRGNIAMARATRSRLRAEYRDRLTAARVEAARLISDQQLAFDELRALQDKLPDLNSMMQRMHKALSGGNVDMLTYTTLQSSHFAQRMKVLLLEQAVLEQSVALDTLTGSLPLSAGVHE
jgi:outer membrane protein TolC